jgi:hypothetical protein
MTTTALVAWPDDRIAGAVADGLSQRGRRWRWLMPVTLAATRATIDADGFALDGEPVDAVLWRVAPEADLSADFAAGDRVFADTEARSFWLAALNLPSLRSVIRPAAELFFARSGWLYWRELLQRQRLRLAALRLGGARRADDSAWLPFAGTALRPPPGAATAALLGAALTPATAAARVAYAGRTLCGAETLAADAQAQVQAAATALDDAGLHLGELLVAHDGGVIAVDALPRIDDADTVRRLLPSILEMLDDAADRR